MAMDGITAGIETGNRSLERRVSIDHMLTKTPKKSRISYDNIRDHMEFIYRNWVSEYQLLEPSKIVSKARKQALRAQLTKEMRAYTGRITSERAMYIDALEEQYVERVKEEGNGVRTAYRQEKNLLKDIEKDTIALRQANEFYERVEAAVYQNISGSRNEIKEELNKLLAAEGEQASTEMREQYCQKVQYVLDNLEEMKAHVATLYAPKQLVPVQRDQATGKVIPLSINQRHYDEVGTELLPQIREEPAQDKVWVPAARSPRTQAPEYVDSPIELTPPNPLAYVQGIVAEITAQGAAVQQKRNEAKTGFDRFEELQLRLAIGESFEDARDSAFLGATKAEQRLAREAVRRKANLTDIVYMSPAETYSPVVQFTPRETNFFKATNHLNTAYYAIPLEERAARPKRETSYKPTPWYATTVKAITGMAAAAALAIGGLYNMVKEFDGFQDNVRTIYESQAHIHGNTYAQTPVQEQHASAVYKQTAETGQAPAAHKAKPAKHAAHQKAKTAVHNSEQAANPQYISALSPTDIKVEAKGPGWMQEVARYQIEQHPETTRTAESQPEWMQHMDAERIMRTYVLGDGVPKLDGTYTSIAMPTFGTKALIQLPTLTETPLIVSEYSAPLQTTVFRF